MTSCRAITTPDVSILHYLHRHGYVDDGHVSAAMTYLDWQAAAGGDAKGTGRGEPPSGDDRRGTKWDCWHRLMTVTAPCIIREIEIIVTIRNIEPASYAGLDKIRGVYIGILEGMADTILEINEFFLLSEAEQRVKMLSDRQHCLAQSQKIHPAG